MLTYNTLLEGDTEALKLLLQKEQLVYNLASIQQFPEKKQSIVVLHSKVYKSARKTNPEIPAQVIIRAIQECLSAYRSIKSNKHKISKPIKKHNLSMRLDKRLYSKPDNSSIRITTLNGRKTYSFTMYPKLKALLGTHKHLDPLIFERDGKVYISLTFDIKLEKQKQKLALGVDVGIRRTVALSDGRLVIDKKFNGDKRKLRHLKDNLKSKGTKSARRHLKALKHKERNQNKNQTHLIANEVLKTKADTIVLENLKGIKRKKHRYQNKRSISQVPMFELRRIITYKAENQGKTVLLVCPSYTSQTDCITGKREGERSGCRFYSKNGLIYDADINASINIAKLSKLPISQPLTGLTYGQAVINRPTKLVQSTSFVCKSPGKPSVLQASFKGN